MFTHREISLPGGADVRLTHDDVRSVHAEMLAAVAGQDIWIVGGGDLAGQFADAGLLDEVWVQYAPVTLGSGAPLLPRRLDLELLEVARNRNFLCGRYSVVSGRSREVTFVERSAEEVRGVFAVWLRSLDWGAWSHSPRVTARATTSSSSPTPTGRSI